MREKLIAAGRATYRVARRFAVAFGIIIAVIVVSTLTIDLGPALKARAEREGGKWLDRKMTIGRLGVQLGRGRFVVENLQIDGMFPHEPPWLVAKRLDVSLKWSALFGREVLFDSVEMSDWRMVVESFPDGRQTFPRLTGPPRPPLTGPRPFVTTLQYVRAHRGELVFNDFGSDWRAVAPNLEVTVAKGDDYRGTMSFSDGTIVIQKYEPMKADSAASLAFVDGKIVMDHIDLVTDGAVSTLTGVVDLPKWPEQLYQIKSRIQFPKMREIFFARDKFSLFGEGHFTGTFHMFRGGRELKGDFTSVLAGVNDYRFPNLEGAVVWVRDRMEVTRASADFSGGKAEFRYLMAPLGKRDQRARAYFDVDYRDVDLSALTDFYRMQGLRLAGRASGRNKLEWPLGRYSERFGSGTATFASTGGAALQGAQLDAGAAAAARARYEVHGPFSSHTPLEPIPVAGEVTYSFDPVALYFEPSRVYTPDTYIAFEGATAYGDRSKMPFRVTSRNWQESDRFLAGLMTAFGAPTRAIPIDGVGRFDGVMLGAFRRPRIEGRFTGSEIRAWDVNWGEVDGDFVVENSYANVSRAVILSGQSRMDVTGQFSLGYPRADGGEQIDGRIRITDRPLVDLREAFDLQDYDIDGALSGDFHVYGDYEGPHGFGRMSIARGVAYDEPFSEAAAALRFEGAGVRLDGIEMKKGGGTVTGAAYVGWNGNYSFNVDGRGVAVETLALTTYPGYPTLYGSLDFTANGSGTFDEPRYDVKWNASDLFFGEEGVGEMTGRLSMRGLLMTYELEAASPRLAVSGTGRIELNDEMDAELSFRVTDTSLDPYVRAIQPTFSPFTSAVASGTIRVVGELYNPDALRIDSTIEQVNLALLDYRLRNAAPIHLSVERQVLQVEALRLVGDDTELDLTGSVNLGDQSLALQANGAANLAVLQGFLADVRGSGRAEVTAHVSGTVAEPVVAGNALLANGRIRQLSFPHALEDVNGIVTFDASGMRLDGVTAQLGGGPVRFGGRIGLSKYQLTEFDVTAAGENLNLRYPEGMRSLVDASLSLQGPAATPMVTGTVTIKSASWTRGFGASGGLFSGLAGGDRVAPVVEGQITPAASNVRFDVGIQAPSTLRVDNDQARIVASADLSLRGTLDRPLLFGRAEIERGEVEFEGRRYLITRGSLDFADATRIQPFFDIEAETRVRVPDQTYRVTMRMAGTTERMQPQFTSDPPLQTLDILTLLFSDLPPGGELAGLQRPDERQQRLVEARATRALTGALSAEVGRVVEQTFGVDTFQITPLLTDPYQQSTSLTLNPTARVTIGKRISDRIFLTYARSLSSSTRDQIILLEFDESETLSWVLSQNEDRTYALEVRKEARILMRRGLLVMLWLAVAAFASDAATEDQPAHLGRTVTDVRVEIAGQPVLDLNVLGLIETRIGEPLEMQAVRSTIDHLVGLGRFEDVRLFATPADQGVTLRWLLTPVRRIARVSVSGNSVLAVSDIRSELADRYGVAPSTTRVNDMITTLKSYYADRGFPRAVILPRIQEQEPAPERVELVLAIEAGERVTIGAANVTGTPLDPPAQVVDRLGLQPGRPYDRPAIEAQIARYEESLRERGYYEAQVRQTSVLAEDGRTVAVTAAVETGPRVSLVFAGDPLPAGDADDLVPIRAERSVDLDLLEDASRAIETGLREQGYRSAQAPYARQQRDGELVVTFSVARGLLHRVASVDIQGNAALDRAVIAPLLQIKPGEPFVEVRAGVVSAAITELYRVRGHTQAAVKTNIQVLPEATDAGVTYRPVAIRFDIEEGPQSVVAAVDVIGTTAISAETLKAQLALAAGRPFYRPQLSVDRDAIDRAYRNRGFQNVSVISQLAFADIQRRVTITWTVREGEQITIDRILINGNDRVATELIQRELTIRRGSPLSDDAMIESQRRLAELGLFRRVRITELPRTGSLTRDVLVDLEEAAATTIDYGGGVEVGRIGGRDDEGFAIDELDIGPRGFFAISRRNLWGKNRSVTLFGRVTFRQDREEENAPADATRGYGFHDYRGLFTFREPRAFGTTGDAQFTAFVEQARRTSFSFNRKGLTSDYARRLAAVTVTGRYTFDYTKVFDEEISVEDQLLIDRLFPQVRLSKVFGAVLRDSRNDVLDPQRGAVLGFDTSVAAKALGSEVGFVKSFFQGFLYRRLPRRSVVIAAGARLGVAVGFDQTVPPVLEIASLPQGGRGALASLSRAIDRAEAFPTVIRELPASERFFAGGDTTVRGFALDRLGTAETLDPQGFPQGGNAMAVFNFETRAPYWKNLQFVWFVDTGNVFRRVSDIRLDELRVASGVGFRYRSPIGPLRVDWGWKLNTQLLLTGGRERSNVLHISLGQAF